MMQLSSLSKNISFGLVLAVQTIFSWTYALRVSIPPSDGFRDIAVTGPQHIESEGDLIYNYIQLANQYLRFSIAVIVFGAIVYVGFKFLTGSGDDAKTTLKNVLINLVVGILIVVMAYTVVRLVINIL